ncbi:MAG: hypothetical protein LC775_11960, partial [Acidobacteria bacterium]|nr:hypothetical protein [Acidobacteriota bacterium]
MTHAQPLAEQGLGDAARAVDGIVVRVGAVGTGDPAHVLGGEGILELFGLPELGGHLRRGDELVARGPRAASTLASRVVCGQTCAASAVELPSWPDCHPPPPSGSAWFRECNGPCHDPGPGDDQGGLPRLSGGGYTYSAGEYVYAWFGIPDGEYLFFGGLPRPQGRDGRGHLRGVCLLGSGSCLPRSVSALPAGADSRTASPP